MLDLNSKVNTFSKWNKHHIDYLKYVTYLYIQSTLKTHISKLVTHSKLLQILHIQHFFYCQRTEAGNIHFDTTPRIPSHPLDVTLTVSDCQKNRSASSFLHNPWLILNKFMMFSHPVAQAIRKLSVRERDIVL